METKDENQQPIDINNLSLASKKSRINAFIIDDLLITFIAVILYWDILSQLENSVAMIMFLNTVIWKLVFVKVAYQTFFIWQYGATIGKLITKTKVVDFDNFGRVTLFNAFMRSSFRIVSEAFFYIGFIIGLVTESRQTLHDRVGKTLVIDA
jgi:uncharacterized RDD family membrane protein YckC